MTYSEIDLQCEDLLWFGVDRAGRVFCCTTAGQGNVPPFVCRSREETGLPAGAAKKPLQRKVDPVLVSQDIHERKRTGNSFL